MENVHQLRLHQHLGLDCADFISIFDKFDEGVIIVNATGVIVYYNEAMGKIDELAPELTLGKQITDVYDLSKDASLILQCLHSARPIINRTLFYRTRLGKLANTIHSVFPLFKKGGLIGAICFVKDYNILDATLTSISQRRQKNNRENGAYYQFKDILGDDPEFLRCIHTARMAASSPSPIMLYGETGTGKELFAQSIHNFSHRRKGQYIPVNCTAIPENLLEGILFGTTKGAFTGALDKEGLFERANGGTLFLDEVNSMPIGLQAKILRVLQEKKVRRVGSLSEIDIDVKIVSSMNKEPHLAIEEHLLRPDLFYRLGVVFIRIPPLRERPDDIPKLVQHFLDKASSTLGIRTRRVDDSVMQLFLAYGWPGNVRELEHVIEGAMNIANEAETLRRQHLPLHFKQLLKQPAERSNLSDQPHAQPATRPTKPPEKEPPNTSRVSSDLTLQAGKSLTARQSAQEKQMIIVALAGTKGNVTRAADTLGISRQLLHYKMKKFQLTRQEFA